MIWYTYYVNWVPGIFEMCVNYVLKYSGFRSDSIRHKQSWFRWSSNKRGLQYASISDSEVSWEKQKNDRKRNIYTWRNIWIASKTNIARLADADLVGGGRGNRPVPPSAVSKRITYSIYLNVMFCVIPCKCIFILLNHITSFFLFIKHKCINFQLQYYYCDWLNAPSEI